MCIRSRICLHYKGGYYYSEVSDQQIDTYHRSLIAYILTISIGIHCCAGLEKFNVKVKGPGLFSLYLLIIASKNLIKKKKKSKARDKSSIFPQASALRVSIVHYLTYDISVQDILLTFILTANEGLLEKLAYLARDCSLGNGKNTIIKP